MEGVQCIWKLLCIRIRTEKNILILEEIDEINMYIDVNTHIHVYTH